MMSAFDDVKKDNKKSYQQLMYDVNKIDGFAEPPYIYLARIIAHFPGSIIIDLE